MAEEVQITGSAAVGKIRNPLGVVGLTIVTLGVYFFVWYYKVNKEMAEMGRARGTDELGTSPATSLMAVLFGWILLFIPPLVSEYKTCDRLNKAERVAGLEGMEAGLLFLLWGFLGPGGHYIFQSNLNKVLQAQAGVAPRGAPPGGGGGGAQAGPAPARPPPPPPPPAEQRPPAHTARPRAVWAVLGSVAPDLLGTAIGLALAARRTARADLLDAIWHDRRWRPLHLAAHSALTPLAIALAGRRSPPARALAAGWAGHLALDAATHSSDPWPLVWPPRAPGWPSPVSYWGPP